jgi:Flp pilus assembly protein TadG
MVLTARAARSDPVTDRGMVTAEFAAALPALAVMLALALAAVGAVTAQLRCVDAARTGARAVARGEALAAAEAATRAAAPSGARVHVTRQGSHIRVEVESQVSLLGPLHGRRWMIPVAATAAAEAEPTAGAP